MTTSTAARRWTVVVLALIVASETAAPSSPPNATAARVHDLFIMYSPNVPREAPDLAMRYLRPGDYVRVESLPSRWRARMSRDHVYALPTTIREMWAGEPGLRHWLRLGCARNTPGTLVYDPEHWELTPRAEQRAFPATVARAARMSAATGCHRFGLAAGATLMYGMAPDGCDFRLQRGLYRHVPWEVVDLVDVQAQLLLSDACSGSTSIADYARLVTSVAAFVRRRHPDIQVVAQVSLRATPSERISAAIAAVSSYVDGVYIALPTRAAHTRCTYCTPGHLRVVLEYLRGEESRDGGAGSAGALGYWLRAAAMSSKPPSTTKDVPVT